MNEWKTANSLPEALISYPDSHWTICNKTTTLSPVAPLTLPVLFSSDYGYYTGSKLYRARFPGTNATSINLTTSNSLSAGWTAWLNGAFLATSPGNATLDLTYTLISLSSSFLRAQNTLTILTDYTGHDETSAKPAGIENPRGILGAALTGSSFLSWRIQGNAGGSANIDPIRGPMNEGGLYGERLGWHLPGFDTSGWEAGSPLTGITKAGVQWYTTTFHLDIAKGLDVPVGIRLSPPAGGGSQGADLREWVSVW